MTSSSRVPWSLAGRLLARDWRSGEVLVLLAALIIAVAAMSAVTFFTDRVRQAVAQQAGEALAADLRLESINPLPSSYRESAERHELAVVDVVSFRSVVLAGDASSLADVRGVSEGYPLRGAVQVADKLSAVPRTITGIPRSGEVWAEPSLLARLGADVGDEIEVGSLRLRVAQTLEFRPDEGWRFMEIAPTALLNLEDVERSGLLAPGSIAEYEALYAGNDRAVAEFRSELEPLLTRDQELEDFRDGRPEVRASVANAERFLVLSALVSVLLGGVAVAMAARRFVARRLDAVALMKCLGARHAEVLRLNLTQLLLLVLAAAIIGSAIGFVAQFGLTALLADFVEAQLPAPSGRDIVLGPITALAVAVGCALPPLLQLGAVPPARVLRNDLGPPPLRYTTIYGVATGTVTAMLYVLFRDLELIVYLLVGAASTFAVLYLAGRVLVMALQRLRGGVGIAWRYGIANVARRGRESSVQVVAFGIGLMVLLLLTLVRTELMVEWQATLPEGAPNHFLINIQPAEREAVGTMLDDYGVAGPQFTPLVRARISHVNGRPVEEFEARTERGRNELEDEINLTWAEELNTDNEIVAGSWWQPGDATPQLSLEEELLAEIGLDLGDEVTYAIGGESFTVRITSARRVHWDSFRPNFFMVLNPGADRTVRAHLHHELSRPPRAKGYHHRSRAPISGRVGHRYRCRAGSGAPSDGPRGFGGAVRVLVHACGRAHGAARRHPGNARRAHVRKRCPSHARSASQHGAPGRRRRVHCAGAALRHACRRRRRGHRILHRNPVVPARLFPRPGVVAQRARGGRSDRRHQRYAGRALGRQRVAGRDVARRLSVTTTAPT